MEHGIGQLQEVSEGIQGFVAGKLITLCLITNVYELVC